MLLIIFIRRMYNLLYLQPDCKTKTRIMENNQNNTEVAAASAYQFAANMLINQGRDAYDVRNALIEQGVNSDTAYTIVDDIENQVTDAKKARAKKDMLYGALWCIGGIAATAANIGFIFWGAIVFGAIQFFKGAVNA